ncbi:TFIIB-type zinc ribbon-containing protein [Streptomyces sp. H27-C3]|uniref:TFIIB-type zinc ribbon-containing protein n=1 Tax=Streptomyces sp. H27-C3 TaxID=3046305 RepID=UPI0024BA9D75|nr:TFIIB-type zinc ribbon-containing protein [Streptomyces sp. H27-C3]MDJ0463164.1 TFIIB-type zinc ribbon-containing protein [Streptomyces sp. H27-C3]
MSDFWARAVGGSGAAPPPPTPSQAPAPVQPAPSQPLLKAQSAADVSRCPNCGSGNYMAPPNTQNYRCYDCGYPKLQSTSGMIASSSDGPPRPARGQVSGSTALNTIVGRVG